MEKMEQKQSQVPPGGRQNKEYQVFELNGVKLDYFDIDLALQGISTLILEYQESVRQRPDFVNSHYNALTHTAEDKFRQILQKMERPPEDKLRPADLYII